ncbi:transcriptional regulator, y4mF family [compost metagenome]
MWILSAGLNAARFPYERGDFSVNVPIDSPKALGHLIRACRKAMDMRQDVAAGVIGVSENFLGKVERGGETVQWGLLFQVMQELGLRVAVEVPEEIAGEAKAQIVRAFNKSAAAHSGKSNPDSGDLDRLLFAIEKSLNSQPDDKAR